MPAPALSTRDREVPFAQTSLAGNLNDTGRSLIDSS